jgi:hypothetical protein
MYIYIYERAVFKKLYEHTKGTGLETGATSSGTAGNDLGTAINYLRGAADIGLGTTIKYLRGAAPIGLGTTAKYLQRSTSGAAGSGLDTKIKYLRHITSGAAGNGRAQRSSTCDAKRAAPRAMA